MSQSRRGMKASSSTAATSNVPGFLADYSNTRVLPPVQIVSEISDGIIVSALAVPMQRTTTAARKSQDFKSGNRSLVVKEAANVVAPSSERVSVAKTYHDTRQDDHHIVTDVTIGKEPVSNKNESEETSRKLEAALTSEKSLRKHISALEKTLEDQRREMREKDVTNADLRQELAAGASLEAKYKELYEAEQAAHETTKEQLSSALAAVDEKDRSIVFGRQRHAEEMGALRLQTDKMLADLRDVKDKEIAVRDEKIKKMKAQMADAFTGNSWERQQQLESLTKELSKTQDEVDSLRQKLRVGGDKVSVPVPAATLCDNCNQLMGRLERKDKVLKERERSLEEATTLCSSLKKQLKDKDDQLKQWTSMQGRVLIFPK